jgi:hypothetical protein
MKPLSKQTEVLFDWWVEFYERALPKEPPKLPTEEIIHRASMLAYDGDPSLVPPMFVAELSGLSPKDRRAIALTRIKSWARKWCSQIEQYMREYYSVNVVFQDGDYTSQGKRIVLNRHTDENVGATRCQAQWDEKHCNGTHAREDANAEQFNRLQPKAAIERHKMVPLLLPKTKK